VQGATDESSASDFIRASPVTFEVTFWPKQTTQLGGQEVKGNNVQEIKVTMIEQVSGCRRT